MSDSRIKLLKENVGTYPDFPKKGIIFRDIFSILRKPELFRILRDVLVDSTKNMVHKIDSIIGLESRGFLFGPILALELGKPFIPIRKKGKLPGSIESVEYILEYGKDKFEIQTDSISKGNNVLIIDDLLATGGTMSAACKLINKIGANVVNCLVIMEIVELNGRKKINSPVHSILQL